jgi:stage III sporulation protein AF
MLVEQIGEWLKGIVVVLLFAAFVDQILPPNGLQRYVKMTLRLIVFVTLLSPIFRIFDVPMHWNQQFVVSEISAQQVPALGQILEQANLLRLSREEQSISWAQKELEKQIKSSISNASQRIVNQVNVAVVQQENGQMSIAKIVVQFGPKVETAMIRPIEIEMSATGGVRNDSKSMQEMKHWQRWIEKNWGQPHTSVSVSLVE